VQYARSDGGGGGVDNGALHGKTGGTEKVQKNTDAM
jgi:hypothetical protein